MLAVWYGPGSVCPSVCTSLSKRLTISRKQCHIIRLYFVWFYFPPLHFDGPASSVPEFSVDSFVRVYLAVLIHHLHMVALSKVFSLVVVNH